MTNPGKNLQRDLHYTFDAQFQFDAYICFFFHCLLTYTFKSDPYLISAFCTGINLHLHLTLETTGMCKRDLAANPGQKIRRG